MEAIKEMLKSSPDHILKARDMARSIYKETPDKHPEMLKEIKVYLMNLHDNSQKEINNV